MGSLWAIYNPVTNTMAGLFSLSATAPTLPSGYTHKAWVGAVYNNTSGNFSAFQQMGNRVSIPTVACGAAISSTTPAELAFPTIVPPAAKLFSGYVSIAYAMPNMGDFRGIVSSNVSGTYYIIMGNYYSAAQALLTASYGAFDIPLLTSNTLWVISSNNTGLTVFCSGWSY